MTMNRRQAIRAAFLSATASLAARIPNLHAQAANAAANPEGPHQLPQLPYSADALEPHIDARTMEIHHERHHAAYVNNLNRALADHPNLRSRSIEELIANLNALPETIRATVRNNGGGHANHALFWKTLSRAGGNPKGQLARAIDQKFGGFQSFQDQFSRAASSVFGSGWAWLSLDGRNLIIETTPNQDSPIMVGRIPLLGIDVWEHAYYLKYQNRRADYIAAFYNVINWDYISDQFQKATA